jgi:hypothetical protein
MTSGNKSSESWFASGSRPYPPMPWLAASSSGATLAGSPSHVLTDDETQFLVLASVENVELRFVRLPEDPTLLPYVVPFAPLLLSADVAGAGPEAGPEAFGAPASPSPPSPSGSDGGKAATREDEMMGDLEEALQSPGDSKGASRTSTSSASSSAALADVSPFVRRGVCINLALFSHALQRRRQIHTSSVHAGRSS